jgi:diguanylate cyclase (GGDEF)-like protein
VEHHTRFQLLIESISLVPRGPEPDGSWLGDVLSQITECVAADAALLLTPVEGGSSWERLVVRPGGSGGGLASESRRLPGPLAGLHARIASGDSKPDLARGVDSKWDRVESVPARELVGAALEGGATGVLSVWNPRMVEAALIIDAAAAALATAFRNRALVRGLEAEVITDELTQVYNYRHLMSALDREVKRTTRHGYPLTVLMIDVDHLKDYNERFGHLAGSRVLRSIAAALRTGVRAIDFVAKYGGDEFLIMLPHTTKHEGHAVAERVRLKVAETEFPRLVAGEMTCSIGVATFPEDGASPELLLAAADRALFGAKRAGRNRVASEPGSRAA